MMLKKHLFCFQCTIRAKIPSVFGGSMYCVGTYIRMAAVCRGKGLVEF